MVANSARVRESLGRTLPSGSPLAIPASLQRLMLLMAQCWAASGKVAPAASAGVTHSAHSSAAVNRRERILLRMVIPSVSVFLWYLCVNMLA